MFNYNNLESKLLRRKLRINQTSAEYFLWSKLRKKQLGVKFFRQYSIGAYIVDFYCSEKRLAIEIDGGQHSEETNVKYDAKRTEFLNTQDILVLRFWNNEIFKNIEGVIEVISVYLKK